jgi:lipid A 4'-phosphatase
MAQAKLTFLDAPGRIDRHTMNRTGLLIALAIAVVVGVVFGLYPELDLRTSQPFHQIVDSRHNVFAMRFYPPVMIARDIGVWLGGVLIAPAVIALVLKLFSPRRKLLVSARAIVFLMATLALGPGLLVNAVLKDHWGRPRPVEVTQFGGPYKFVAWWDPRGACPGNCSFVSGDISGAMWTMAPAALAPPQWRALAYGGALALTAGMSALRIIAGGHFFTDAVFAGVFTFLVVWFGYALIYRWPRTQLSDEATERAIERIATPPHDFVMKLFGRKPRSTP